MPTKNSISQLDLHSLMPMRVLMDSVEDMRFVIKDMESRYLYVNPCWLQRNGLISAERVLGKTASEVFPHWRAERYLREERRVTEEGLVYDYEELLLNSYGDLERWRTIKAPWMQGNQICGYINIGTRLESKDLERRIDKIPLVVQLIADKACESISMNEIAKSLGISKRTLERKFKAEMEMTPQAFRSKCRILRSKKMLLDGMSAAAVSDACGFSDQSHFSKSFASHLGITPKKFQIQQREQNKSNFM